MKPAAAPSPYHANVRASAARAVSRVLRGSSLDDALLPATRFRVPADAAMARLLAYGVLRELSLLQGLTAQMMDKQLAVRSEEQKSELQSLMRNSYAVFCLKKKKTRQNQN